jgi:hypothetical protein
MKSAVLQNYIIYFAPKDIAEEAEPAAFAGPPALREGEDSE